jgi:hypothetical protein
VAVKTRDAAAGAQASMPGWWGLDSPEDTMQHEREPNVPSPMILAMEGLRSVRAMNADQYLMSLIRRETVDTGDNSPVRGVIAILRPALVKWGNNYLLGIAPSGSFAKSTAIRSGTDIDLFLETPDNLRDIYQTLFNAMQGANYAPKKQNVSINIRVGAYDVDLVPAQRQDNRTNDHSLYRSRKDSWTKTNVQKHIQTVRAGGRLVETRILKLWRNQKSLDFPSFYLELTVIDALRNSQLSLLSDRVRRVLEYFQDSFVNARVQDPANTNNVISDDLTVR